MSKSWLALYAILILFCSCQMLEGMNIQEDEEVSSVSVDSIDTEDILERIYITNEISCSSRIKNLFRCICSRGWPLMITLAVLGAAVGAGYFLTESCEVMYDACTVCSDDISGVSNIISEAREVIGAIQEFIKQCPNSKEQIEQAIKTCMEAGANIVNQCCDGQ